MTSSTTCWQFRSFRRRSSMVNVPFSTSSASSWVRRRLRPRWRQDPLVALADAEHLAHVVGGHPLDVTKHHDLTLTCREAVECGLDTGQPALGDQPLVDRRLPRLGGQRPGARRVEAGRRSARDRPAGRCAVPSSPRAGPVDQDAEQPGLERRPTLEAVDTADDAHPGVLDRFLGDRAVRDIRARDPEEGCLVPADENHEGTFVTSSEQLEELGVHRSTAGRLGRGSAQHCFRRGTRHSCRVRFTRSISVLALFGHPTALSDADDGRNARRVDRPPPAARRAPPTAHRPPPTAHRHRHRLRGPCRLPSGCSFVV